MKRSNSGLHCLMLVGCLLLGGAQFSVRAQRQPYLKTIWTTEQGLPQNTITAICQTRDGYLWLGTFGGLVRFDGVRFTVFNTVNAPALANQRITALYEDAGGTLWIGTETGEIARYQAGQFSAFDGYDGQVGAGIEALLVDSKGALWASDSRLGLRHYTFNNAKLSSKERVRLPGQAGEVEERVPAICQDRDGAIWFIHISGNSKSARLVRYRDGTLREFGTNDGLPTGIDREGFWHLSDLALDRAGTLWVATAAGVARFDGRRFVLELPEKATPDATRLTTDRHGNLWVTSNNGVFQRANGNWVRYPPVVSKTFIRVTLADSEGNLWLGTNGAGLWRLRPRYVQAFNQADGLAKNGTNVVLEDRAGQLWIGGFGLQRFENGKIVAVPGSKPTQVTALGQSHDGTLYLGGYDTFFSYRQARFTDHSADLKAVLGGRQFQVKAIFEDRRGALWLGLGEAGLLRLRDGKYERFTTETGLAHDTVHFITEARDGALWFGTLGGASKFAEGKFANFTTAAGLGNNTVRAIYEDRDGAIWFGTYGGGLTRLKNGRLKTITMHDGLFDDVVSRLLTDEQDNFWMLGNRGVFVAARGALDAVANGRSRQIICRAYGVADGMLSSEGSGGNMPAGWRTHDGRFWFPTLDGYAAITPTPPSTFLPPAIIEEAALEGQPVDWRQPLDLKPGQQNLEIRYTGLSFTNSELLRFRYKLAGLDDNWVEAGTRRTAYYSYLPPGEYVFTVVAANSDGVWNTVGPSTRIRVLPSFYRTWWFMALAVLSLSGLTYSGFRLRVTQLEREKRRQRDFSRRLLELQEAERKRIAAELHDSLSQNLVVIKNRAWLSLREPENPQQALEQLEEIADAAEQSLFEVREIAYHLRPAQIDRLGLTTAIETLAKKTATPELCVRCQADNIDHLLPAEAEINLYRIIQESLNNILKHAAATEAVVKIECQSEAIEVVIQDNGQGFDTTATRLSESNHGSGFGLVGITERARILGCVPKIQAAPGQGTQIRLRICKTKSA